MAVTARSAFDFRIFVGRSLSGVMRDFAMRQGTLDRTRGPVRLDFDGDDPVYIDVGGDGERLTVTPAVKVDAEVLLRTSGSERSKLDGYRLVDVSREAGFAGLRGSISRVLSRPNVNGDIVELCLTVGVNSLCILGDADDVWVTTRHSNSPELVLDKDWPLANLLPIFDVLEAAGNRLVDHPIAAGFNVPTWRVAHTIDFDLIRRVLSIAEHLVLDKEQDRIVDTTTGAMIAGPNKSSATLGPDDDPERAATHL